MHENIGLFFRTLKLERNECVRNCRGSWMLSLKISKNCVNIRTRTLSPRNNRIVDKTVKYALKITTILSTRCFFAYFTILSTRFKRKNWLWIKRYLTKKMDKTGSPRIIMLMTFTMLKNRSPTYQRCHHHKPFPTSVTDIGMAGYV